MLKKDITFDDFEGNEQTETHYFHLSDAELIKLELSEATGWVERLEAIVKSMDGKAIIAETENFILTSYGIRSEDGKRFLKSDQISEEFSQTAAYSALFFELATDAEKSAEFVNGLMPADRIEKLRKKLENTDKPVIIAKPLMPA